MDVEVIVKINGQQVMSMEETVEGKADAVEEKASQLAQRIGCQLIQSGLQEIADQATRPAACPCCSGKLRHKGHRPLTIACLEGPVLIQRVRYRCRDCNKDCYPADAPLFLGSNHVSLPLANRLCQLGVLSPFGDLEELVWNQHRLKIGKDVIHDLVWVAGGEAQRRRLQEAADWEALPVKERLWPPAEGEPLPERIYISCDGIMYCTRNREPDPNHPGKNRLIWQEMKVGCVYWQDAKGNWQKRMVWGRESPEEFGRSLFLLACRCGYREAKEKIFAADGSEWCWNIQAMYFSAASGVLDWYHLSEHIWETARELHGSAGAKSFAEEALGILRQQGGSGLLGWLRPQKKKRRGKKRESLQGLIEYIEGRKSKTDYPSYRTQGWQIGTGMMESTVKQLVAMRLKGPGMRWSEEGALAMTALKAQYLMGNWENFWQTNPLGMAM